MGLNEIGQLVQKYWVEIPNHFAFIELGNFVVMPNHVHGILIIDKNDMGTVDLVGSVVETPNLGVSITEKTMRTAAANKKWKPNTIGSIINQYKRICTINARKIHSDFAWQSRFHDHIIHDANEFERIQNYIENNPKNGMKINFMNKLQSKIPQIRFPEFKELWDHSFLGDLVQKTDKKNKENKNLPVYTINNTVAFVPQDEQFEGRNSQERGFDINIYKIIGSKTFAYNPARINVGSTGYSFD
jgi:REP element-mobilizing transposase RayT